jgi:hypothetical protein
LQVESDGRERTRRTLAQKRKQIVDSHLLKCCMLQKTNKTKKNKTAFNIHS